jgi:hypothetical protein
MHCVQVQVSCIIVLAAGYQELITIGYLQHLRANLLVLMLVISRLHSVALYGGFNGSCMWITKLELLLDWHA